MKRWNEEKKDYVVIRERMYSMVAPLTFGSLIAAGKTEATKIMLQFLAARAEGTANDTSVQQQILDANPVLEAFGTWRK